MTLVDKVEKNLSGNRSPMNMREIAEAINNQIIIGKGNDASVSSSQVSATVKSHPELFDTVSSEVFLTRDDSWKAFIKAFTYFKNLFYYKGYTKPLIPYLIFYKRISDLGLLEPDHSAIRLRNRPAHTFDHIILEDFNKAIAKII